MGAGCSTPPPRQVPSTTTEKEKFKHFIVQVHGKDTELTTHLQKEADNMFRDMKRGDMSYAEFRARYG